MNNENTGLLSKIYILVCKFWGNQNFFVSLDVILIFPLPLVVQNLPSQGYFFGFLFNKKYQQSFDQWWCIILCCLRHTKNEKWQMGLKLLNFHLSRNYLAETYLFLPFSSLLSVYDLPNLMWLLKFCLSLLGWFYSMGRKKVPPR